MSKQAMLFCLHVSVSMLAVLPLLSSARTDELEVQTIREMYTALNCPPQLENWELVGGDPCEDHWVGVSCFGSSVTHISLTGLNLTGTLDFQISNLQQLIELDLSSNSIEGEIPYALPLNLMHLSLALNRFSQRIPDSLSNLKNLKILNLSHNILSGQLGDFSGLGNLREMDLSHNNLTGDLPSSVRGLTSLTSLFLQNNSLTGSVILLSQLPLKDLNIADNHFSGVIPENFQKIRNLWIGGNRFDRIQNYTPWSFPLDFLHNEQNISSPPSPQIGGHKKKRLSFEGIVAIVVGATILGTCVAILVLVLLCGSHKQLLDVIEGNQNSTHSFPTSSTIRDFSTAAQEESHQSSRMISLPEPLGLPPAAPTTAVNVSTRRSFAKKFKIPMCVKHYTMAEIESATNSFSQENLIGDGSFGSIYRAEFPNGQLSIVYQINKVEPTLVDEQLLDMIRTSSRLRHPNIMTLIGYTVEVGGHCILVYEYVRNVSLYDALHNEACMTLPWNLRLRVALGVARALNYMHSSCVPPIAHGNLTAARILLDEDLRPHISDCGLANIRRMIKNSVKLKALELAADGSSYDSSEDNDIHVSTKEDVYDFGVLLLELLTGRHPCDSGRSRRKAAKADEEEADLVQWAIPRLHDNASLAQMVDPLIRNTIPAKTLSHLADIILLCLQAEEFRAPMSEVVEALMCVVQKSSSAVRGEVATDPFDRSFRSTSTHFVSSPTQSYYSI
ncbi:unnamed protein product [Cuscuta europaea]|uniref:Protein kinase domain-containing protein n=1 Tax=Cuscuta europaea TaxID=41803 RepID=A0A9P0ZZ45_CUSEU|nr:unnamed protein product [Cuscuta europaea]